MHPKQRACDYFISYTKHDFSVKWDKMCIETAPRRLQRMANNTPISHSDKRGMETQTSAVQDVKY
jgi:uncharacterized protein YkwD